MALRTVLEDIRVSKTHATAFTLTRTLPPFPLIRCFADRHAVVPRGHSLCAPGFFYAGKIRPQGKTLTPRRG